MIMVMVNSRLDKARSAYRTGNLTLNQEAHLPHAIANSLKEEHATGSLSDVILGGQDGLVNVLGVILGVAAASGDARIIQAAGLAAAFAESVSMGAVAYTSTLADSEHYQSELKREKWEIENNPEGEKEEIRQIYLKRGFAGQLLADVVETITNNQKVWTEVMMAEELKLSPVPKNQAFKSAAVVGIAAIVGSFIPLFPFFLLPVRTGIYSALFISAITLFLVGVYKARVTMGNWGKSAVELTVIGMISALVGYLVGALFKAPFVP